MAQQDMATVKPNTVSIPEMVCYMIIKWGESVREDALSNFFSLFHLSQVLICGAK